MPSTPDTSRKRPTRQRLKPARWGVLGGRVRGEGVLGENEEQLDPAQRPVTEGGGGVAEGFEEAERALIEHASHGDQQAAHAILHDQGPPEEELTAREDSRLRPRAQQRARRRAVSGAARSRRGAVVTRRGRGAVVSPSGARPRPACGGGAAAAQTTTARTEAHLASLSPRPP